MTEIVLEVMETTDEPDYLVAERAASVQQLAATDAESTDDRTSWWPQPFSEVSTEPVRTTLLARTDGIALLYLGRLHAFIGESEALKTWCAYVAAVDAVRLDGHVHIVDFEDVSATALERLLALGLSPEELDRQVHFIRPEEPLLDRQGRWTNGQRDLVDSFASWPPMLAIFDGVTEGMGLEGLNPLDNSDVARWYRAVPRRAAETGAAVVVIDHVTKSREDRGRYALGGVHKLNGLDGAGYVLEAVEAFAPGHEGISRITVAKDRPGAVRAHAVDRKRVGDLVLTPNGDLIDAVIRPPETSPSFEPTRLMEKVSRRCELYPGSTKTDLRGLGNSDAVDLAIERLHDRGHLRVEREGRSLRHHIEQPYRETPDA